MQDKHSYHASRPTLSRARIRGKSDVARARSQPSIDLTSRPDLADLDELTSAIDGEHNSQSSDPSCAVACATLQWFRVPSKRVLGNLLDAGEYTLPHWLRYAAEVALRWARDMDLITHSPRIWRRSCSSVT